MIVNKNNCIRILLLVLFLILPSAVFAGFREQKLAVIPSGYKLDKTNVIFSPDGNNVAFAARHGTKSIVFFGGMRSKPYDSVRHIKISPDGRAVAHNGTVITGKGDLLEYRVVNGVETGPFQRVCNPIFSPDSRMVVFEVKAEEKWSHAVSALNENRIAAETGKADLHWMEPVFSKDGRFIVSIQQHHSAKKNVRLVSTAREMQEAGRREYDSITDVVYSLDRIRTAYVVKEAEKAFMVTSSFAGGDEQEGAAFDVVSQPILSADGDHVGYFAERDGNKFLVVDGREIPAPYSQDRFPPVFSPDWERFAYVGFRKGKQFVVSTDKESPPYDDLSAVSMSPDGHFIAFGASLKGKWRIRVNGAGGPVYDLIDEVQFSPDGRHVIYRALKGDKFLMVLADLNGKSVLEGPLFEKIWQPSFDEEGRLGYGALNGKEIWWKVLVAD